MTDTTANSPAATARQAQFNHKDTTLFWIGVSLVLHVLLILVTSVGFIRDHYVDPEGAAVRKAEAEAAAIAAKAPATQPATAPSVTQPAKPADGKPAQTTESKPADAQQMTLEERKETPMVKKTTEAAKPSEIPKSPDDLGLNLDDVNSRKK